jgi:hypothetical protein
MKRRVCRAFCSALVLGSLSGCGTDGESPTCPGYPEPYDNRVEASRLEAWEELAPLSGPPHNCATLPVGFSPESSGSGGQLQAGEAGAGGAMDSAGAGGAP